jgi:hypothetical protein
VPFPTPVPGLVIRYSYLWASEHARGQEEGVKDRPCAIVLTTGEHADKTMVTVLPVTHSQPADARLAIEIPHATKRRLGLYDARSWVVLTEANRFIWPGPDLVPSRSGDPSSVAYGMLPHAQFEVIRLTFIDTVKARIARTVPRSQ